VYLAGITSEPEDNVETVSVCDVLISEIPPKQKKRTFFFFLFLYLIGRPPKQEKSTFLGVGCHGH
jgi:hypothetical protein